MNSILRTLAIITTIILLSACSGQETKEDTAAGVEDGTTDTGSSSVVTSGADSLGKINGIAIDQEGSPEYVRTIFFEYDRSEVRSEFIPVVRAHAQLLASDSSRRVVLEGHADERGSREYNIALGERRAISVRRLMVASGAGSNQIRLVSYGEERPAVIGHNEDAWSKNRRVEVRYE
jgi:peptidoglycan-associated lipoprotein